MQSPTKGGRYVRTRDGAIVPRAEAMAAPKASKKTTKNLTAAASGADTVTAEVADNETGGN